MSRVTKAEKTVTVSNVYRDIILYRNQIFLTGQEDYYPMTIKHIEGFKTDAGYVGLCVTAVMPFPPWDLEYYLGYVGIEPDSPMMHILQGDNPLSKAVKESVHGGITYEGRLDHIKELPDGLRHLHYYGFDTAHSCDIEFFRNSALNPKPVSKKDLKFVREEVQLLARKLKELEEVQVFFGRGRWTPAAAVRCHRAR